AMASMDWDDYLRHEAAMYRQLAEKSENVFGKQELLDLAAVCEEVANNVEDRLTGGEPPSSLLQERHIDIGTDESWSTRAQCHSGALVAAVIFLIVLAGIVIIYSNLS